LIVEQRWHIIFFLTYPVVLCTLITMADVEIINLEDATVVEKRGRGGP
jgi:hypothetical protein